MKRRERFLLIDETLHDDPAPRPQDAIEHAWLMEQRFVHGLLRALHTADAAEREARIQGILARLPTRTARPLPRRVWTAAATLLLGGLLALWVVGGGTSLPRAEAMVARAIDTLSKPLDRRYELTVTHSDGGSAPTAREVELTLHTGRMFLVRGTWPLLGTFQLGSDGKQVWFDRDGMPRPRTFSPEQSQRLESMLARLGPTIELGYFDLETTLASLPSTCTLQTVGRENGPDGEALVRVDATRLPARSGAKVQSAFLLVSEATGEIVHAELVLVPARRPNVKTTVVFHYRGTVDLEDSAYAVPSR